MSCLKNVRPLRTQQSRHGKRNCLWRWNPHAAISWESPWLIWVGAYALIHYGFILVSSLTNTSRYFIVTIMDTNEKPACTGANDTDTPLHRMLGVLAGPWTIYLIWVLSI